MPTQFYQADGSLTDTVQKSSTSQYVAGTIFLPSETKAPATSTVNSIVVYDNFDGVFHNIKDIGGATITSDGIVEAEVTFNDLVDQSTSGETQPVNVNPGNTAVTIDLALGTTIRLLHDENVVITFTNIPVGHVTNVIIDRRKENNTNPVTLGFSHTLKTEGRQQLTLSNEAGARDFIVLFIKDGVIYARTPVLNFGQSSGTIITTNTYQSLMPESQNLPVSQVADPNTIVCFTGNGYFVTTSVPWDGSTFAAPVNSRNNKVALMYFPIAAKTASVDSPLQLDASFSIFGELLLDANVTTIELINAPLPNLTTYVLFVKHDNTANVYDITWTADFKYDTKPTLTQEPDAEDILMIKTLDGTNKVVHCFQNFGTPV